MAATKRKAKAGRKTKKRAKCLTCDNLAQTRGLCFTCRAAARSAIQTGKYSEQELIDRGLMLPHKRMGRPTTSGFSRALSKAEQNKGR